MTNGLKFFLCVTLGVLIATSLGCGDPVGPKSGVVLFSDGSPVTAGSIELRRRSDKERFSSRISLDGTFQPKDTDGVVGIPPGSFDVVVVQIVMTEDLAKEAHTHGMTVPRKYADYYTSGLQVDVKEGQVDPVEIRIALEDDEKG